MWRGFCVSPRYYTSCIRSSRSRAPGAKSWCTETCCVRSRVPGDRLNGDAGSVGSLALQVEDRLCRAGSEGVIALQVAGRAGARGHHAPGGRRLHSAGVRGHRTPGDRLTATCGGVRLYSSMHVTGGPMRELGFSCRPSVFGCPNLLGSTRYCTYVTLFSLIPLWATT